jgi:hypothetical protein
VKISPKFERFFLNLQSVPSYTSHLLLTHHGLRIKRNVDSRKRKAMCC